MRQASSDRRELLTDRLLGVAEFSHAHWFFGNLYEALVKIPDRLAASDASPGLPRTPLGAGSPGRYYAPIAPINAPCRPSCPHDGLESFQQQGLADRGRCEFHDRGGRYGVPAPLDQP